MNFLATSRRGVIVPDPSQAGRVAVWLAQAGEKQFRVSLEKETKRRTLGQNRRFWRIMQVFEALGWEKTEAKEWLCDQFLDPIVREFPDGTRAETTRGTRFLTTAEMAKFMDDIERFLNLKGLWWPEEEH